ncbi:MAG: hypothetical protein EXQ94_10170 [Alphaproteobacteria bacterium]|nr:hypothetical protein [Alphaproteobacteria bacterium]
MYEIDTKRTDLALEFKKNPWGPHSAELQRILNRMRWEPLKGKHVLVCTKPHQEWKLAELPGERGKPVKVHEDVVFTNLEAAEWDIFKRRWKRITGQDLRVE